MFASGPFQLRSASLVQTSSYATVCGPCGM